MILYTEEELSLQTGYLREQNMKYTTAKKS